MLRPILHAASLYAEQTIYKTYNIKISNINVPISCNVTENLYFYQICVSSFLRSNIKHLTKSPEMHCFNFKLGKIQNNTVSSIILNLSPYYVIHPPFRYLMYKNSILLSMCVTKF